MVNRMHNGVGSEFSRRGFLSVTGLAAGSLLLAACSGTSVTGSSTPRPTFTATYDGPKVTLNYWNGLTGGDGDTMLSMVDAFNAAHENIQVKTTSMVWADLYSKIVTAVEAGEGPEVALMQLDQLATFAVRGTIVPLDDVTNALGLTENDFAPSVWSGSLFREKRYGIPLDMFTIAQYWDVAAFEKAGITGPLNGASEFDAAMKALHGSGIANPFWVPSISPMWQMWFGLLTQHDGQLYNANTEKYDFASEAGIDALEWMVAQVKNGVSPEGVVDIRPAMMSGKAAYLTDGLWSIADFSTNAPDLDVDLSAFPTIGSKAGAFANSHNFTLTKQADTDENAGTAARVFVDWISKNSVGWSASGNIPARASARDEKEFTSSPQAALNKSEVYDAFTFLPQLPGGRDIGGNTYQPAIAEAVLLQSTPKAALQAAQTNAQRQLDENRKLYGF
ncbi:extracellular solute-binding protein [Microbacterium sp. A94]|uniref:extracellular solute-binding protein n=1 Tax=Microbacterium sp. A94 TaxID=3450717 RepID=UPI003F4406B2